MAMQHGYLGRVTNGEFRRLAPSGVGDDTVRLTSIAVEEARPPETGELDIRELEAKVVLVNGHYDGGWIYSAEIAETATPLVGLIAEEALSPAPATAGAIPVEALETALNLLTVRVENSMRDVRAQLAGSLPATCRNWEAWHNRQPGAEPKLHVVGSCSFPTAGYDVELSRHEPQGINPHDLLLDLAVRSRYGAKTEAATGTDVEVRFEEETDFDYETVTILPAGPTVPVTEVV
jgi:hypothetical protein